MSARARQSTVYLQWFSTTRGTVITRARTKTANAATDLLSAETRTGEICLPVKINCVPPRFDVPSLICRQLNCKRLSKWSFITGFLVTFFFLVLCQFILGEIKLDRHWDASIYSSGERLSIKNLIKTTMENITCSKQKCDRTLWKRKKSKWRNSKGQSKEQYLVKMNSFPALMSLSSVLGLSYQTLVWLLASIHTGKKPRSNVSPQMCCYSYLLCKSLPSWPRSARELRSTLASQILRQGMFLNYKIGRAPSFFTRADQRCIHINDFYLLSLPYLTRGLR